jgi:hypothetical protein
MGFSAAFSRDHHQSLNNEAYAQPDQGAKEHRMTTRPTAFPWMLLAQGGRQRRQSDRFAVHSLAHDPRLLKKWPKSPPFARFHRAPSEDPQYSSVRPPARGM